MKRTYQIIKTNRALQLQISCPINMNHTMNVKTCMYLPGPILSKCRTREDSESQVQEITLNVAVIVTKQNKTNRPLTAKKCPIRLYPFSYICRKILYVD